MRNTKTETDSMLIIGIGNSGRRDDGLGWKFLDLLEVRYGKFCDIEYRYQLQIEDSELISKYDLVVFVDASHAKNECGYDIIPCDTVQYYHFSSHAQEPGTILYFSEQLYGHKPEAYILGICGEEWEFREGLSPKAEANLQKGIKALEIFCVKKGLPCKINV